MPSEKELTFSIISMSRETKQFIEKKIKELRDEFAMGNDQTTILGAKGSADRIADFF